MNESDVIAPFILGAGYFLPIYLMIAGFVLAVLLWLRCDLITTGLFMLAAAFSALRFISLDPEALTSDMRGHLNYIAHIASQGSLPDPWGWQSQQPPLFYAMAALGYRGAEMMGYDPRFGARYISTLFYYGFAIASMLCLRLTLRRSWIYYLCLALLLFWPASSHMSVKINNDIGGACFVMLCFYALLRWLKTHDSKNLGLALAAAGGGLACKGSALLAPAMILLTLICGRFIHARRQSLRNTVLYLGLVVFLLGVSANFGRTFYYRLNGDHELHWMVNRQGDLTLGWDYVGNKRTDYLLFDTRDFVKEPFIKFHQTVPQAAMFWNVSLKTLLLDAYKQHSGTIARILNLCWLLQLAMLAGLSLWALRAKQFSQEMFLTLSGIALSFAMLMALRFTIPVSFSASARYIYFAVPLLLLLYGLLLERWLFVQRHKILRVLPLLPGTALLLFSLLFFAFQFVRL